MTQPLFTLHSGSYFRVGNGSSMRGRLVEADYEAGFATVEVREGNSAKRICIAPTTEVVQMKQEEEVVVVETQQTEVPLTPSEPRIKQPSSKELAYRAWHAGERDVQKLVDITGGAIKLVTAKTWCYQWVKGNDLPACTREMSAPKTAKQKKSKRGC